MQKQKMNQLELLRGKWTRKRRPIMILLRSVGTRWIAEVTKTKLRLLLFTVVFILAILSVWFRPWRLKKSTNNFAAFQPFAVVDPPLSKGEIINRKVFKQAQDCLQDSPFAPKDLPRLLVDKSYSLPSDVESHYREMLEITADLRNAQYSSYTGYHGPWLENVFIEEFCCDKPLSAFGGLVPLFVQWNDLWQYNGEELWLTLEGSRLLAHLRKDVIYVTVAQHDEGIFWNRRYVSPAKHFNILVLNAGGAGHAALPLFSREQPWNPTQPLTVPNLFVFAGSIREFPTRNKMRRILEQTSAQEPYYAYKIYRGPLWKDVLRSGAVSLSPRGWGRSSFRTTELIQSGNLPLYLYDDHDWSPYKGTDAHISNFGWSVQIDEFPAFINATVHGLLADPDYLKIDERRLRMLKVRDSHYTLPGLVKRLGEFFSGSKANSIGCQRHPEHIKDEALLTEWEFRVWVADSPC